MQPFQHLHLGQLLTGRRDLFDELDVIAHVLPVLVFKSHPAVISTAVLAFKVVDGKLWHTVKQQSTHLFCEVRVVACIVLLHGDFVSYLQEQLGVDFALLILAKHACDVQRNLLRLRLVPILFACEYIHDVAFKQLVVSIYSQHAICDSILKHQLDGKVGTESEFKPVGLLGRLSGLVEEH